MTKKLNIGLAGNPNSGKTTLFNRLTGARQHVGNYPGVTVEKKEGVCRHNGHELRITDLPGTYSLTAYSTEEKVARDFIIHESPDVLIDVVDASNLERNLYLAVQFMELGVPLVLALNMSDVAKARGLEFDIELLSELFGVPIVPTVGTRGEGLDELVEAAIAVAKNGRSDPRAVVDYGPDIEQELETLQGLIKEGAQSLPDLDPEQGSEEKDNSRLAHHNPRWIAVKLLENDEDVRKRVNDEAIFSAVDASSLHIERLLGSHPEMIIADRRYGLISGACQEAVRSTVEERHTRSDQIDTIVTSRVLGFPIFLGLMYLTFQFTFTVGERPMVWIESFFGWLSMVISGFWPMGAESALKSLVVDGIIGGVGGVLVFLPNILLLFLAISILEDSGYMARAAFLMDRLMHKIGLHGKSFIPMLLGFGCSVPAIMATRTLESRRDRIATMLVVPLMSCSARLPIYALIIPAFFPKSLQAPILLTLYCIGIVLAILGAKILRATFFKGENQPFVMELPLYRVPTIRATLTHMFERSWLYCKKAGTIILSLSIILWAMTSYPKKTIFERDYGAEQAAVQQVFLDKVQQLNVPLGLSAESKLLSQAIMWELTMAAEQRKYYEDQPQFAAAQEAQDAAIGELLRSQDGAVLAHFLDFRDRVAAARDNFALAVNEMALKEGLPGYAALEQEHNAVIAAIENEDPDAFATAVRYLDEVKGPFEGELEAIARARGAEELAYSVTGRVGRAIEPLLKPMGFDWRIGTALIGALAAKEVFVAQMGIVFSVGEADEGSEALRFRLRQNYSPLVAFCIMLFCLVSAPCMATIAVTKRESNSWKWALFQLGSLTVLAYVLTVVVFQVGTLLGIAV